MTSSVSPLPRNRERLLRVIGDIDVTHLLPKLSIPVLLLHSRGDARVPFEHGLRLARAIPKARFVPLESKNHIILSHEPAFGRLFDEMCKFLDEDASHLLGIPPPDLTQAASKGSF